jgi:septal ring factor EnvC (AmiA/AmiB activator)
MLAVVLVLHAWQQRAAQLTAARADLATCTAQYAALQDQVTQQNAAIADYRAKAAAQQQAADAAQAQARSQIEQSQRRLQRILTAPVPAECPAAVAWTREQAAAIGARWARGAP